MDKEVVFRLNDKLLSWFRLARRDLPWRQERTPYRVWISEIMLQQTRVETVLSYF
ncbi:MAG: A/G-specific adenine glycosylase, partial [Clostridiaceae bacterium]|nr:A/G-specific adenine glycosylase [Clostridiaceae bacterium]